MTKNRVLIVDDEVSIRELLVDICEKEGLITDCVCDGLAAQVLMNSIPRKYLVIFLDLAMPNWDGLDALETYQRCTTRNVVIISGAVDRELRDYLEQHPSVFRVLLKPFDASDVITLLHELKEIDASEENS